MSELTTQSPSGTVIQLIWWEPEFQNEEERYRYEERLGILEVPGLPTIPQYELAMADVREYRDARLVDLETPLCAYPKPHEIENDWTQFKPGKPSLPVLLKTPTENQNQIWRLCAKILFGELQEKLQSGIQTGTE